MNTIRVGIVGLGANTRLRHVPGLRACDNVQIVSVCNRRPESTRRVADEYGIPKTFDNWQELVADDDIDAVVIGTWPYLHCAVTVAAIQARKHVLVEARMARNADEAHLMFEASRQNCKLVTQIVPSPLGLRIHQTMKELLDDGYVGELREVVVLGCNAGCADPSAPLHWRQSAEFSGLNMLMLGILHETLIRWVPDPVRVLAETQIFTPQRVDAIRGNRVVEFTNFATGVRYMEFTEAVARSAVGGHAVPLPLERR